MSDTNIVYDTILNLSTSSIDKRISNAENNLRRLRLENEMDVLLIHNPAFEISEAMLTIDAGSIYDPEHIPGLALLVEHLIFKGSENYNSNTEWMDFLFKRGGNVRGTTSPEKIEFLLQCRDEDLNQTLNYLVDGINKPLIRAEDCLVEIELIDHQWCISNYGYINKVKHFSDLLIDETFEESKFSIRNNKNLLQPKIAEEAKNFHAKYFKANRMKLVIKSKLSLDSLEKISEKFEYISTEIGHNLPFQKRQKITQNAFLKKRNKLKHNKTESLLNDSVDIKYKEAYRGKIVKFNVRSNEVFAYINFCFPSHLNGFTSIHMQYLIESCFQQLQMMRYFASRVKNFELKQNNFRRKNTFSILIHFFEEDFKTINIVISMIYEYFNKLEPHKLFFESVKQTEISKITSDMNESAVLKTYSDYFFLYSKHELGEFEAAVEYDEKILLDLFQKLTDIKNWTVFVYTNDDNLPYFTPNHECSFDNPISITIESEVQNFFRNKEMISYQPIPKLKIELPEIKIDLPEVKPNITHSKLMFGEYTIISEPKIFGEYCEIILSFFSSYDKSKKYSYELFNLSLSNIVRKLCTEKAIDVQIQMKNGYLFDNNLIIKIKKEQLSGFITILADQIHLPVFIDSLKNEEKYIKIREFEACEKSELLSISKVKVLPYIIKNFKVELYENVEIRSKFVENYYLMITAVGNITDLEVLQIYNKLKSRGDRRKLTGLIYQDTSFKFDAPGSDDNSLIMAYHISAESKLKEFAFASLLKLIFSSHLNELLKVKNGFSFVNHVDYIYVHQQVFLTFNLRTLQDTFLIKDEIKRMIENYSEIIDKISAEDLILFKKTACQKFDWKINSVESLSLYAFFIALVGIHDNNLQEAIKEAINSVENSDLKSLTDKFIIEPIVIYGLNTI